MLMSAELKECVAWFKSFWIFFRQVITVPSFIILGYVWQILGRGAFLSPHPWAAPKTPILNRVKTNSSWQITESISWLGGCSICRWTGNEVFQYGISIFLEKKWPGNDIFNTRRCRWLLEKIMRKQDLKS